MTGQPLLIRMISKFVSQSPNTYLVSRSDSSAMPFLKFNNQIYGVHVCIYVFRSVKVDSRYNNCGMYLYCTRMYLHVHMCMYVFHKYN